MSYEKMATQMFMNTMEAVADKCWQDVLAQFRAKMGHELLEPLASTNEHAFKVGFVMGVRWALLQETDLD